MKRGYRKIVTKLSTEDQIENHIKMCLELKIRISNDPNCIKSIVIDDKTWIFGFLKQVLSS